MYKKFTCSFICLILLVFFVGRVSSVFCSEREACLKHAQLGEALRLFQKKIKKIPLQQKLDDSTSAYKEKVTVIFDEVINDSFKKVKNSIAISEKLSKSANGFTQEEILYIKKIGFQVSKR